ncbi:MAG: 2-phospho-L-lactate guanylyltransferase [Pseudolabrys sp.]|nr:2-phospho-L-lactate guanylyltransferase [Pseudolabrys sp.]MDP2296995.1 2-phospho-L-lactate guanylyltransferase [Pseudolabrys sp.]
MACWVIIPVKSVAGGKSRLAGILSDIERYALNSSLILHVLKTGIAVVGASHTLAVSADPEALALAIGQGANALTEVPAEGLNGALSQACRRAKERGADTIMVLPCDLPFLIPDDVKALREAAAGGKSVVLAPDRAEAGTNALVVPATMDHVFRFGQGSFIAHQNLFLCGGLNCRILRRPSLAFDLDTPDDYALFQESFAPGKD